jgi:hypothetical protein
MKNFILPTENDYWFDLYPTIKRCRKTTGPSKIITWNLYPMVADKQNK